VLVLGLIGLGVWWQQRGPRMRRAGSSHYGTGPGPRDW
jgi:hypothetical protein